MNTFIQNDANKKTMPEVAAMVPEFNTAVNTYIATAVKQLDMRIQNRPKEEEFVKNIDELMSKAADFRTNVRRMINNADAILLSGNIIKKYLTLPLTDDEKVAEEAFLKNIR